MSGTAHQPASTRGGREAEFNYSAVRPGEAALLPANGLTGAWRWSTHQRPDRQACGRPGHHAAGGESTTSSLTRSVRMETLRSPHPRRPSSAPATARTRPPDWRLGSAGPASTAAAAWKRLRSWRPSARRVVRLSQRRVGRAPSSSPRSRGAHALPSRGRLGRTRTDHLPLVPALVVMRETGRPSGGSSSWLDVRRTCGRKTRSGWIEEIKQLAGHFAAPAG